MEFIVIFSKINFSLNINKNRKNNNQPNLSYYGIKFKIVWTHLSGLFRTATFMIKITVKFNWLTKVVVLVDYYVFCKKIYLLQKENSFLLNIWLGTFNKLYIFLTWFLFQIVIWLTLTRAFCNFVQSSQFSVLRL